MANSPRKTALAYIRVSTEEQTKGFSLDAQAEAIEQYCTNEGIQLLGCFREAGKSAKTFNQRPEWSKLIEYAERHRKSVDLILVTKYDRFSRNFYEACSMLMRLQSWNIEVVAIEQQVDTEIPENSMLEAIYLVQPQIENRRRGKNTQTGMLKAQRDGIYLGTTPIGYLNSRDHKGKRLLVPDPSTREAIHSAFVDFATGSYTVEEVRRRLLGRGVLRSRSQFYNVLRNPAYAGMLRITDVKDATRSAMQPGNIQGIISPEIWDQVQERLAQRGRS